MTTDGVAHLHIVAMSCYELQNFNSYFDDQSHSQMVIRGATKLF